MKNSHTYTHILLFVAVLILLSTPFVVYAQEPSFPESIVPCTDADCGWEDLVQLGSNVLGFLVALAFFVAVGLFTYAGFLYVTAVGNTGKLDKAHKIFINAIVGFIITLGAWLIVNFILMALGIQEGFSLLI